jgi:L-threonylcarbamoyladenylate synthase
MSIIMKESDKGSIENMIKILSLGGIVAFATDTIYGLACDASNDKAVNKLYKLKGRTRNKAIALFVENTSEAAKVVNFGLKSTIIARNFMPGPITLILEEKNSGLLSKMLNEDKLDIGIRIPDHNFSLNLLRDFSGFLAVTSANISNQSCATNIDEIKNYFKDEIDLIIDGGNCCKKSSTVLKINESSGELKILREGPITKKEIIKILKENESS